MNPARDAWNAALELLRGDGHLSDSQTAFARMVYPITTADDTFLVAVGSDFVKTWVESHIVDDMTGMLSAILGRTIHISITVDPAILEKPAEEQNDDPAPADTGASTVPGATAVPAAAATPAVPAATATPATPAPAANPRFEQQFEQHFEPPKFDSARFDSPRFDSPNSQFGTPASSLAQPGPAHAEAGYGAGRGSSSERAGDAPNEAPEKPAFPNYDLTPKAPASFSTDGTLDKRDYEVFLRRSKEAGLNPKYTFDNFVVGESNRFATATALSVSEAPGSDYNPFFIYSDSGMGKTHLMHAIGNYALSFFPNAVVRYISSEEFTNEFINAVRDQKQSEFKASFRNVDLLLIDDIQFIGKRESIMEEFFHTFNALTNANKQIVITSDVAPNLLNGFEERLLSRFNSGVVLSIDRPNLETRIAILEKKGAADRIAVPRDVLEYIATNVTTNVREMEGALRRVTAFADLSKEPVSLTLAEMVLKDLIANPDTVEITPSVIMAQTAGYFQVSLDDITGPERSRAIVTARQIAMYLCREMTNLSLPKIGQIFGGRDHTTVMHAYRKIDQQMAQKQTTYNQVTELSVRIKQAAAQQAA